MRKKTKNRMNQKHGGDWAMEIENITSMAKPAYHGNNTQQIDGENNTAAENNTITEALVKPAAITSSSDQEENKERMNNKDVSNGQQKNNETIKKAVEEINRNASCSEAIFGIHEKTNRVTIKIVNKDTKKVIKEFPPEKTLDMIAKVWEMAGLMVDEKR